MARLGGTALTVGVWEKQMPGNSLWARTREPWIPAQVPWPLLSSPVLGFPLCTGGGGLSGD